MSSANVIITPLGSHDIQHLNESEGLPIPVAASDPAGARSPPPLLPPPAVVAPRGTLYESREGTQWARALHPPLGEAGNSLPRLQHPRVAALADRRAEVSTNRYLDWAASTVTLVNFRSGRE